MKQIQRILDKLNKLKEQDKDFEVNGAKEHKYKFRPVLSDKKIEQFETKNKLQLPEDFRWMLLNMGNGGIGPNHNCWQLSLKENLKGEFPLKYGEMYSMKDFEEEYENDDDANIAIRIASQKASQGQITIGYNIDHAELNLVLKGAAAGTVWSVDFGVDSYGAYPVTSPYREGEPMTFADWFEIWLDKALENSYPDYRDYIDFDAYEHISIPKKELDAHKTKIEAAEKKKQAKGKAKNKTADFDTLLNDMIATNGASAQIKKYDALMQLIESGNLSCSPMQRNFAKYKFFDKILYVFNSNICKESSYKILRNKLIEESKKALSLLPYPVPDNKTEITFEIRGIPFTYETDTWQKIMYCRAANSFSKYTSEVDGDLNEALKVIDSALVYNDVVDPFFTMFGSAYKIDRTRKKILKEMNKKTTKTMTK